MPHAKKENLMEQIQLGLQDNQEHQRRCKTIDIYFI